MNRKSGTAGEGNWVIAVIAAVVLLLLAVPLAAKLRPAGAAAEGDSASAAAPPTTEAPSVEKIVVQNAGFEEGQGLPVGWSQGNPVQGVEALWLRNQGHSGQSSIGFRKPVQKFWPIAEWYQIVQIPTGAKKIKVSAWVKAEGAYKAVVDVQWGEGHEWAAYVGAKGDNDPPATHDWQLYSGVVELPAGTSNVTLALQMYGPGAVAFDDVTVEPVS